jgi:hypothetical protein
VCTWTDGRRSSIHAALLLLPPLTRHHRLRLRLRLRLLQIKEENPRLARDSKVGHAAVCRAAPAAAATCAATLSTGSSAGQCHQLRAPTAPRCVAARAPPLQQVLRVTMDNVYEVFTTPRETTGLAGIHFRFMPDMAQVKHALQVRVRGASGARALAVCGGPSVPAAWCPHALHGAARAPAQRVRHTTHAPPNHTHTHPSRLRAAVQGG